ncbi:MAG: alpha/beta fold hydrolase [Gammaproteobacteria bacterium]|nr:alpha/beta fold hydrolase [Gammaproteobacteria bacterium]
MPDLTHQIEPIVFLPGWGFNGRVWSNVAGCFSGARLLDLPCLPRVNLTATVNYLSEHIPDQSVVVSWSLGGLIATELCYRFPEKCSKLILVSTTPKFSASADWLGIGNPIVRELHRRLNGNADKMMDYFFRLVQFPDRDIEVKNYLSHYQLNIKLYNKWLRSYLALLFASDVRHRYSEIKQPLLHILGQKDAVVKTDIAELRKLNSSAVIEVIEGAGHVPFVTHHEVFMTMIKRFLNRDEL